MKVISWLTQRLPEFFSSSIDQQKPSVDWSKKFRDFYFISRPSRSHQSTDQKNSQTFISSVDQVEVISRLIKKIPEKFISSVDQAEIISRLIRKIPEKLTSSVDKVEIISRQDRQIPEHFTSSVAQGEFISRLNIFISRLEEKGDQTDIFQRIKSLMSTTQISSVDWQSSSVDWETTHVDIWAKNLLFNRNISNFK